MTNEWNDFSQNWDGFSMINLCIILSSLDTDREHIQRNTHTHMWAESGAYLPRYLSIKVRVELSLPPRGACQNKTTHRHNSSKCRHFYNAGEKGSAGLCFPRVHCLVGGQTVTGSAVVPAGDVREEGGLQDQVFIIIRPNFKQSCLHFGKQEQQEETRLWFSVCSGQYACIPQGCTEINSSQCCLLHTVFMLPGGRAVLERHVQAGNGNLAAPRSSSFPPATAFPNPSIQHPTHNLSVQGSANLSFFFLLLLLMLLVLL